MQADARAAHQRRIVDHLAEHPCVDCGQADRLASMNIAWERVAAEIAKCSVRCANCHRRRTAEMFGCSRAPAERERVAATRAAAASRLAAILVG